MESNNPNLLQTCFCIIYICVKEILKIIDSGQHNILLYLDKYTTFIEYLFEVWDLSLKFVTVVLAERRYVLFYSESAWKNWHTYQDFSGLP